MESKNEILLTQEGYQKLEDEVEFLKTVRRREVAERIKIAISFGDISENAEYDEAKNEQAQLEERIMKLENMNPVILTGAAVVILMVCIAVSAFVSIGIMKKKEF